MVNKSQPSGWKPPAVVISTLGKYPKHFSIVVGCTIRNMVEPRERIHCRKAVDDKIVSWLATVTKV